MGDDSVRQRNRETLDRIRELLRTGDWQGLSACWADDGVMELPYALPGTPARTVGREAISANAAGSLALFSSFQTPEFTIFPTVDPDVFFAEYRSEAVIRPTGRTYNNLYVGYFRFRDGALVHWKEYFNPSVIREAFRP